MDSSTFIFEGYFLMHIELQVGSFFSSFEKLISCACMDSDKKPTLIFFPSYVIMSLFLLLVLGWFVLCVNWIGPLWTQIFGHTLLWVFLRVFSDGINV